MIRSQLRKVLTKIFRLGNVQCTDNNEHIKNTLVAGDIILHSCTDTLTNDCMFTTAAIYLSKEKVAILNSNNSISIVECRNVLCDKSLAILRLRKTSISNSYILLFLSNCAFNYAHDNDYKVQDNVDLIRKFIDINEYNSNYQLKLDDYYKDDKTFNIQLVVRNGKIIK